MLIFSSGEPNNNSGEDCLALLSKYSWNWNDESCSLKRAFICELHGSFKILDCLSIFNLDLIADISLLI